MSGELQLGLTTGNAGFAGLMNAAAQETQMQEENARLQAQKAAQEQQMIGGGLGLALGLISLF